MKSLAALKLLLAPPTLCGAILVLLAATLPAHLHAQTPGSLDLAYQNPATDQPVQVVVAQTVDGVTRAIIGGSFSSLLDDAGTPVPGFARFNADGSLDTAFLANASGTTLGTVTALALQPDGKLLVAGHDGSLNIGSNSVLLRFGADGTPDTGFRVTLDDDVESIAFQADGSILISGFFTRVNGTGGQRRLSRLSTAGVLDTGFAAYTNNALTITEVKRIAVLPNGGLLAVTHVSEGDVDYLIQLAATDGSVPDAPTFFHLANDGRIYDLNVDSTGRVIVVGNFDGIDNHPRASHLARFGADGQIDNNFVGNQVLPSVLLQSVVVDANGQPLVGGVTFFTAALFRLTADTGAIDPTFSFPLGNEGNYIQSLALQPDGTLLAAGQYSIGQRAANLVRVVTGTGGGTTGPTLDHVTVAVPGTSNIWLAGAAPGTTASSGQDNLTNATPFLVSGLTITPGSALTFTAAGNVSNDPANPVTVGPDGGPYLGTTFYSHIVENSVGSIIAPINSLIGVFLDASTPSGTPPDGLDFSGGGTPAAGTDYATLAPALLQPFFIGDGTTSTGVAQGITVPAGATRLYLGSLDPSDQENNPGLFQVTIATGTGGGSTSVGGVVVPGTANPYLASLPDGATASGGDDSAPAESPVLVPDLALSPNKPLNFSVAGSVSADNTSIPFESPDGGFFLTHNAENSFTKTVAPINSLIGVFLSDAAPDPTRVNDQVRDFSDAASTNGGVDFTGYQPDLGKPFFIGDGKTGAGIVQNVYPPAGATRLFLGIMDGNDYFNNLGKYTVGVTQSSDIDTSKLQLGLSVSTPNSNDGSTALIGDRITYTFHVKNAGSHTFTNVIVKDVLPGVYELVSASNGGAVKNGVVTWNLGTLAPTGNTTRDLTLVVKTFSAGDSSASVSAAQINQVVNNNSYFLTGDGLPQTVPGQNLSGTTKLLSPVSVAFTSNGASIAPGQTLMYTVDLHNTTGDKVKGVTFSVALPTALKNPTYYFVDANGVRLTDLDANVSVNAGLLTFNVGTIKSNQDARLVINGYVPFDVIPNGDFALTSGRLVTKTGDGFGQNSFGVLAPATKLTGSAITPPALTLAKVIPDGPSLVTFFKLAPKFAKKAQALLPGAMFFKTDASGKQVLDDAAVATYGTSLNPSIGEENDDDGIFTTVALPKPNTPPPTVTVALFYSNSGGADAANIVLRDPVPDGFTYLDGSALLNGKFGTVVPVSVENNGRLLVITAGKVKAGDSGLLTYTLTLNVNPPAAGTVEKTQGAQLMTSGLTNSVNAFPDGPDLLLVGNFFVQADPTLPNGTQAPVNGVVTYDLLYTNTGGKKAKDLQVTCSVPAGTQFVRALPLNLDRSEPAGGDTDARVSRPAPNATSGQIVFRLGKLGLHKQGRVRVQYRLTAAQLAKGLPDVPNPFVISDGPAPAAALAEAHRVARGLQPARNPRPRDTGADSSVTTTPVARILDPSVPRLFVVKTVPLVAEPGKTFDYLTTVGNMSDVAFGDVVDHKSNGFVSEQLPADLQFVSIQGNDDSASEPAHADANNEVIYTVPPLPPHSSATIKITVQPKASALGKTLTIPVSRLSVISVADDLYSGALTTRVIDPSQLKVSSADITGAAVARFNATAASVPNVTGNLTYKSPSTSVVGADDVAFTNGALLIPLGNGQAFLSGSKNAVGTTGGAPYTGSSAGTLAFSTAAEQLYVHNLIGKPPGGQSSVVLTAAGRDVATILRQIVSSDAGSVVAKGGASPHPTGALNLFGTAPGTFVSNDPAPPPPRQVLATLLPPGGLALATGIGNTTLATLAGVLPPNGSVTVTKGGNIVETGGGNIVAQGGGNVVSNDGGSLVAQSGGNLQPIGSSQGTSALISNDGGGLISNDGGGLISNDGGGLISNDGGGLISNDGGGN